jgi:hypothetical protein
MVPDVTSLWRVDLICGGFQILSRSEGQPAFAVSLSSAWSSSFRHCNPHWNFGSVSAFPIHFTLTSFRNMKFQLFSRLLLIWYKVCYKFFLVFRWCSNGLLEPSICAVKVKQSHYSPGQAQRVPGIWGPRFQDSRYMKVVRLSVLSTARLYPSGNILGTHFC